MGGGMNREDYIKVINEEFSGQAQKLLLEQVENFYELENIELKNEKYKAGDYVKLKKNTLMHGFGSSLEILDLFANQGLINKDFEYGKGKHKISHCVSLWHIKKDIKLADYILSYSGMTVRYDDKHIMVPYRKFDEFIEKIRKSDYWSLEVESSMETRFMPSLSKDSDRLQLAFIINARDKVCQKLMWHNLLNDDIDVETVFNFMHFNPNNKSRNPKQPSHEEMFRKNRQQDDDKRIAYIMFGIPKNMFEGVLVGRKYEKNKRVLKHIKEVLPDCYICNLDGRVIVE